MVIQLEVLYDSPLSIAEALIQREMMRCKDEYSAQVARENTWQMGMALLNHAESCKRIEQWAEPQMDFLVKTPHKSRESHEKKNEQTDCPWK